MKSNKEKKIKIVDLKKIQEAFPEISKTFEIKTKYIFKKYGQDWGLNNTEFFIIEKGKEIISSLFLLTIPIICGGLVIRAGGLACVRTSKKHRQKGNATDLVNFALDYRRKRGINNFFLFTNIPAFYFRFEFEPYHDFFYRTVIDLENIEKKVSGIKIRQMKEKDIFQIASLYDNFSRRYNLTVARSLNYWKWQLSWIGLNQDFKSEVKNHPEFIVVEEGGQIIGYVRSVLKRKHLDIYECISTVEKAYCLQPAIYRVFKKAKDNEVNEANIYAPRDSNLIEHFKPGQWLNTGELLVLSKGDDFFKRKINRNPFFISRYDHF